MKEYLDVYLIATTLMFILLALIWEKSTLINLFLKFAFTGFSIAGVFLSLDYYGYVVKAVQ